MAAAATALTATGVLTLGASAPAAATPGGSGVKAELLQQRTDGDTTVLLRKITIPPGQNTGWHSHRGALFGFVEKGTLSHFDATCESDGVYRRGTSILETPGEVHIGVNKGRVPVVLIVTYVLPKGALPADDAPAPHCRIR